jgi:hypothetical protein
VNKFWFCKDFETGKVLYASSAPKMRKFRLAYPAAVVEEIEYNYKTELMVILENAYHTGFEDGKATNS